MKIGGAGVEGALAGRCGIAAFAAVFAIAFVAVFVLAPAARAHGPTVEIGEAGLKPVLLNLFVGTTVHFANTIHAPEGLVVVDEGGSFESPRLRAPGDGWHYTFEQPGSHTIRIAGRPEATMRVVIVPRRTP